MPENCEPRYNLTDEYFKAPTQAECAKSTSSELPDGHYWTAKLILDTVIYGLVFATAGLLGLYKTLIETLAREFNLNTTDQLITVWENSVGLPDPRVGDTPLTLCDRRNAVLQRLDKTPTVTLVQMQLLVDQQFPDYGIWLVRRDSGESFRYDFRYPFGPNAGFRETFVIEVHIPWLAISDPPELDDPLTIENLLDWFHDFIGAYVLLLPIYESQASYTVITGPQNGGTVYAISDGAGDYEDIPVYWKTIDTDGTVINRLDTEDIQPDQTEIERSFTDSTVSLISTTNEVNVITLL